MIEKRMHIAVLYDFYGKLLTEKQRWAMELFYEEDYSLGEISSLSGSSRQAVYDLISRSENLLEHYEECLGMVAAYLRRQDRLSYLERLAATIEHEPTNERWLEFWRIWYQMADEERR